MPTESDLRQVRRDIRRQTWRLKTIAIRQAARRGFDLPRLGTGPLERITVSLILAGVFGFATLGVAHFPTMETKYRLLLAGVAFATVLLTSAVLVLWGRDDESLENERLATLDQVAYLSGRSAELEELLDLEDAESHERDEREAALRERNRPTTKRCPYCREVIAIRAVKCRYCGEILDADLADERRAPAFNPGVAAVLSFLIPGLGQIYKGQVLAGMLWLMLVYGMYVFSWAGTFFCCGLGLFLLPVVCLFDAASGR